MNRRFLQSLILVLLGPLAGWAQEGTLKWRSYLANPLNSSPALSTSASSGYVIYIGSAGAIALASRLYAVNPGGSLRFQYAGVTDWVDSTPTVGPDGTIYFGSWDTKIVALAASNSLRWSRLTSGFVASSAAIGSDGTVYIGSGDRNLYALNSDGSVKWTYPVSDWIDSSPAIGPEDTIYFGSFDRNVYAVRSDGTLRWQFTTGDTVTSSPAIGSDATIYVGSNDGKLYALDGASGALKWSYTTGSGIAASPVIGPDGSIYVGSLDGYFYALDSNGGLRWRFNAGAEIYSSAAIRADGTLFFGANFYLYAVNSDGSQRWRYTTGDYVDSSPVIAGDGTILVGSSDRYLYAIYGNGQGPDTSAPWPLHRQNSQRTGRSPVSSFPALSPPTISSQPLSISAEAGSATGFSVLANGTGPFTYQWFKDNVEISGANRDTYIISSAQVSDAGSYFVRVTNSGGSVDSDSATLTVTVPVIAPTITTSPSSQAVNVGAPASFIVVASGTTPFTYQWYKNSYPIPGATSVNYSISAAALSDAADYAVTVTNSAGSALSSAATLTVQRLAQTLTFAGPPSQSFTFAAIPLSATASSGLAPSFTVLSGPASLSGSSLSLTGIGTVYVRAEQSGDATYAAATPITRSFAISSSYDYWLLQNFTSTEISGGVRTAPSAIAANDGVPNLIKYALGLAPKSVASLPLPLATISDWAFSFTRPSGQTDVSVGVEFSSDLATWSATPSSLTGTSNGVDTWNASVPRAAAPNGFFRLKVTRP